MAKFKTGDCVVFIGTDDMNELTVQKMNVVSYRSDGKVECSYIDIVRGYQVKNVYDEEFLRPCYRIGDIVVMRVHEVVHGFKILDKDSTGYRVTSRTSPIMYFNEVLFAGSILEEKRLTDGEKAKLVADRLNHDWPN